MGAKIAERQVSFSVFRFKVWLGMGMILKRQLKFRPWNVAGGWQRGGRIVADNELRVLVRKQMGLINNQCALDWQ
jgi:hypothetical protein